MSYNEGLRKVLLERGIGLHLHGAIDALLKELIGVYTRMMLRAVTQHCGQAVADKVLASMTANRELPYSELS